MAKLSRNFIAGIMNKSFDERLIPNGEYIDALNVRMGATERSEIGVIENTKGNTQLTQISFWGIPLSSSAVTIGTYADSARETIYWFIHDDNFDNEATVDMIVSFNAVSGNITYHVVSVSVLNFNAQFPIVGIDMIDDLLFFTDNYNPPRFININRSYEYPSYYDDGDSISSESLLVIKRPPMDAPAYQLFQSPSQQNYLQERFICFAYRYKYADGEFSATSAFSSPAFLPKSFEFSISSFLNEGMVNYANAVNVVYSSGSKLVKGIELLFKEADSNIIKVIEYLDKEQLGLLDNTTYAYEFNGNKIFTILPDYELLRLYDNVPLTAAAQTIMGNRLMYGNYTEGYDLLDYNNQRIRLDFFTELSSVSPIGGEITATLESGAYTFGSAVTVPNAEIVIDLSGNSLAQGNVLNISLTFQHSSFNNDLLFGASNVGGTALFEFRFNRSYSSVYDLVSSAEFQAAIGITTNIENPQNACVGTTLTDSINCIIGNLPMAGGTGTWYKYRSGIDAAGEPIGITTNILDSFFTLQIPAMQFVDNLTTPTLFAYEYFTVSSAEGSIATTAYPRSLHSNRNYEIGIIYMDEYSRASTALVSPTNTTYIPCDASLTENSIKVYIPPSQRAPSWATKYKFAIRVDKDNYQTVYANYFINDNEDDAVYSYILLEGENARKVDTGDRLIVKSDSNGATQSCTYVTVLEKKAQERNFLGDSLPTPAGVYMKIDANAITLEKSPTDYFSNGPTGECINFAGVLNNKYATAFYTVNYFNGTDYDDFFIQEGAEVRLSINTLRPPSPVFSPKEYNSHYKFQKTFISSAPYANFKDWWDGDYIYASLNDANVFVSEYDAAAGCTTIGNSYNSVIATTMEIDGAPCSNKYQFFRDGTNNQLVLMVSGLRPTVFGNPACTFVNIEVFNAANIIAFETEPSDTLPDVFYESEQSFFIGDEGLHEGNIQNQTADNPAIIDTGFFNCFSMGNGVESYRVRDSIVGHSFGLGNRVTTTAGKQYRRADRFADITYSGIYNNESNLNRLNEFNSGLLNFKNLEQSFGAIRVIDGKRTDVLVLQEDKISYVLAEKNLLSDAGGGSALSSVPEVLGTQIARVENYGISDDATSYVQWGENRFFSDSKRGAVLMLTGGGKSSGGLETTDALTVISELGMRTWFRDLFNDSPDTFKLGAYDPYMGEYVFTSSDLFKPSTPITLSCGVSKMFSQSTNYDVALNQIVGDVVISYSPSTDNPFEVIVTYNGSTVTSGEVTEEGSISFTKNSLLVNTCSVELISEYPVTINVNCPTSDLVTMIEIVISEASDAGKFLHVGYNYVYNGFSSVSQVSPVQMGENLGQDFIVSFYRRATAVRGSATAPPLSSELNIFMEKIGSDNFTLSNTNSVFYLESNTEYANSEAGLTELLASSVQIPTNAIGTTKRLATTTVGTDTQFIYIIYDLSSSIPLTLCYSSESEADACCECTECEDGSCPKYTITSPEEVSTEFYYTQCNGNPLYYNLPAGDSVTLCSKTYPTFTSGDLGTVEFVQCNCDL